MRRWRRWIYLSWSFGLASVLVAGRDPDWLFYVAYGAAIGCLCIGYHASYTPRR